MLENSQNAGFEFFTVQASTINCFIFLKLFMFMRETNMNGKVFTKNWR